LIDDRQRRRSRAKQQWRGVNAHQHAVLLTRRNDLVSLQRVAAGISVAR